MKNMSIIEEMESVKPIGPRVASGNRRRSPVSRDPFHRYQMAERRRVRKDFAANVAAIAVLALTAWILYFLVQPV